MSKKNILIVDDELVQCKILSKLVENLGYNYLIINNGSEVVNFFSHNKIINNLTSDDIDIMLLDLSMPDLDGLEVLKQITSIKGDLSIIVLTAHVDTSLIISAINLGAIDYIIKGQKNVFDRINASIANAIEKRNLKNKISHLKRQDQGQITFTDIIGNSEKMINIINSAKRVANLFVPVLIQGPQGSSKEFIARAIHGSSLRSAKPFIRVECELLQNHNAGNILFGYNRTLVDGKAENNPGKIHQAIGGTLFLEKVDMLTLDIQSQILKFIKEIEFISSFKYPPSEHKSNYNRQLAKTNIRIISSASKNLLKLVKEKRFNKDLLRYLSSHVIRVPGLKDRGNEDIKLLAESFCHDFAANENKKINNISPEALDLLYNYQWQDNVRQLKHVIFRAVVLCNDQELKAKHFPQLLDQENNSYIEANSFIKKNCNINTELIDIFDDNGKCKSLNVIVEEIIRRLINLHGGNLSEVAKRLDIGRSTVYRRLGITE
jgi:DNA-binding NtrC family response regulator